VTTVPATVTVIETPFVPFIWLVVFTFNWNCFVVVL
jgi:hypothetical protein